MQVVAGMCIAAERETIRAIDVLGQANRKSDFGSGAAGPRTRGSFRYRKLVYEFSGTIYIVVDFSVLSASARISRSSAASTSTTACVTTSSSTARASCSSRRPPTRSAATTASSTSTSRSTTSHHHGERSGPSRHPAGRVHAAVPTRMETVRAQLLADNVRGEAAALDEDD